ncbi:hypothetical protein KAR91_08545 [Candidatus Pacearchaeota archaeon]|nr:hypothetical protein [Candidatus Pacearchaeota archaeon]
MDITTYLAGLAVTILGSLGVLNIHQVGSVKKNAVSDKTCGERRDAEYKKIDIKLDSIIRELKRQADETKEQWGVITEVRDIAIDTKATVRGTHDT